MICLLLAVAGCFPFILQIRQAVPGPSLSPPAQLLIWLPWQLADNLDAGRALLDNTVFVPPPPGDLLDVVGNPGFGLLLLPLQVLGDPLFAFNVGILLVAASNVFAAWALGRAVCPEDLLLRWGFAGVTAGAGWMWHQLGAGAIGSVWLAPAVGAALLLAERPPSGLRAAAAALLFGLGLLAAPVVTGGVFVILLGLSELRLPRTTLGVLAGAALLVGLLAPPIGAALPLPGFPPAALAWPMAGTSLGLPMVVLIGLWCLVMSRKWWPAAAAGALLLVAMGPTVRFADGSPVLVQGHELVTFVDLGGLHTHARSWLTLGALVAAWGALSWWEKLGTRARGAVAILGFLEVWGQEALGQPVRLWTEHVLRVPPFFEELARAPRTAPLLQLPPFTLNEGAVIWVPWHRQMIVGGPGINRGGPIREVVEGLVRGPVFGTLVNALGVGVGGELPPAWRVQQEGYRYLLYHGPEANARVRLAGAYGTAIFEDGGLAVYDLGDRTVPPIEVSTTPPEGEASGGVRSGETLTSHEVAPPAEDAPPLPGTERLPRGTPPPGVIPRRDPSLPPELPPGPPDGAVVPGSPAAPPPPPPTGGPPPPPRPVQP